MDAAGSCLMSLLCFVVLWNASEQSRRPHIILIVADDLGWNDVSWNNPSMITPKLKSLANAGVILNQSYVQPLCTPSRTALMTGYYPYHVGLQHGVIIGTQPNFVPENYTVLPQKLKDLGYATHMVGKWHLGFCNWKYTPTYRGFDSFVGYYQGQEDYYSHVAGGGYDFRFNEKVYKISSNYSTNIFAERAIEIINSHNATDAPLFLYLPFQAVHAPIEVPDKYADLYPDIKDNNRRHYCGMVSALDEAVGNITQALQDRGFLDNAVIFFTTDNGGIPLRGGNNFPLRGMKGTLWEGGTRGAAFVYSKTLLKKKGYVSNEMMHIVDINPTIVNVAGGMQDAGQDGVSQWGMISKGLPSARTEFVYNFDNIARNGAIRVGNYKLIKGNPGLGGWYPPPRGESKAIFNVTGWKDDMELFEQGSNDINTDAKYRLFDIKNDPTEHVDLATSKPDMLKKMIERLYKLEASQTPARYPPFDPRGNPIFYGGNWSPGWC